MDEDVEKKGQKYLDVRSQTNKTSSTVATTAAYYNSYLPTRLYLYYNNAHIGQRTIVFDSSLENQGDLITIAQQTDLECNNS